MTAEIAIINRRAVTLAADSAVAIKGANGDVKIFNSAEKIFELCSHQPIGLMIYNAVNFLEAPLEILARDFRADTKTDFATLIDCAEALLKFLTACGNATPEAVRNQHLQDKIFERARIVNETAFQQFRQQASGASKSPQELIREAIDAELQALRQSKVIESHANISWQDVYASHQDPVDQALSAAQGHMPLDSADLPLAQEWASRCLLSNEFSEGLTGLIVAGYGHESIYPSLISYEIDGFVCGRLRCEETNRVVIEPGKQSVDIITFAQEDISRRLLDGIDPEIVEGLFDHFFGHLGMMRQSVLANVPPASLQAVEQDWNRAAARFIQGIGRALDTFRGKCNSEFYQTVASMPKQEMAFFAEALVNTTAMKRKVSEDTEDVGGPVDVAVISKHDGFI